MALTEEDETSVVNKVEASILAKAKAAGAPVVLAFERSEAKTLDPYRPLLQFLTGLLAFCLTLIVALIAALNADKSHAINALVSWVLVGMSITAAVGTIAIGFLQWAKSKNDANLGKIGRGATVVTVLCGVATVLACVHGARAIAERHCISKPAEGVDAKDLSGVLIAQYGRQARTFAEARSRDCVADGDLASGVAWAKIAGGLPQ